jgi:hypothetical protein
MDHTAQLSKSDSQMFGAFILGEISENNGCQIWQVEWTKVNNPLFQW